MKTNMMSVMYTLLGVALFSTGLLLVKTLVDPQGVMLPLPYICIGIGCGIFGHNMGNILSRKALKNHPDIAKNIMIEQNDERNTMIGNRAKAKAYDMMIFVFGALMMAFSLMGVDIMEILLLVGAYLFVVFYGVYFRTKYDKEM